MPSILKPNRRPLHKPRSWDIRPTIPETAADLYHQWDERQEPETTKELIARVCKQIGAGFEGARRYVINRKGCEGKSGPLTGSGFA